MDFSLDEDLQSVVDLTAKICADGLSVARFKELDGGVDWDLWSTLASAGVLGISLPAAYGGSEQGFLATAVVLEEIGRSAAPVPLLASVVMGGLVVAEFGTDAQKEALLPGVADGSIVMTAALYEPGGTPMATGVPAMTARRGADGGWTLDGVKTCVLAGMVAHKLLVPAAVDGGVGVFIVDASAVSRTALITTSGGPSAHIELSGAAGELLGGSADAGIVEWLVTHAQAAACSQLAGGCKEVVSLTAAYTKSREQFERVIATFQAVAQRAADAYIDAEAIQLTSRAAAWRLSSGLPASEAVAIAKFWAADGGQRVVHAGQHLHGGVGVDRDYPLHRYFFMAKELELMLGGATANLLKLGAKLAAEPAPV